jgi:hypothetical protein
MPSWNSEKCELFFGRFLVKKFRVPAWNQQSVLRTFEDAKWPVRIDDPLLRSTRIDPKKRLHETIAALNRNQVNRLIRFCGDGSGRGVTWLPITAPATTNVAGPFDKLQRFGPSSLPASASGFQD